MVNTITEQLANPKETVEELRIRATELKNETLEKVDDTFQTAKERGLDTGYGAIESSLKLTRRWAVASKLRGPAQRIQTALSNVHEKRRSIHRPTIVEYDNLTVKEIATELGALSRRELQKLISYEETNKNRKTVLDAANKKLDAKLAA